MTAARVTEPRQEPTGPAPAPTSIALCVLTYRRPRGLAATLSSLGRLDTRGLCLDVRVVVVDNDAAGSARPVVSDLEGHLPWPVTYAVEPVRGIPRARNRAVALAGDADLVGWLDDDEVADTAWLRLLLAAQRSGGADVVLGPSVPALPPGTPGWVADGGFFERTRFATGSRIPPHYARTSGVIVRRAAMPLRERPFDEALGLAGGSDRELFVEMHAAGATIEWVDEAVVTEHVPASRARAAWILRRAYRIGNSRSTTLVLAGAGTGRRARRVVAGLRKVAAGAAGTVVAAGSAARRRGGRADVVQAASQCANGAGLVTGALGLRYQEYRRHHGG